jgi:hypothetical protein
MINYLDFFHELLVEVDINDIPLLSNYIESRKLKFRPNNKLTDFVYSGMNHEIEEKIFRVCYQYLNAKDTKLKQKYKNYLEMAYLYIISKNPELKNIPLNIQGYDSLRSPMYDIVCGVVSGIPLDDLIYFIVDCKGYGINVPDKQKEKGYISKT